MNILLDALPESVEIDGADYPVNWGYRTFILIEICIFDTKISDNVRLATAMNYFYVDVPPDPSQAFEKMMWFYRGGVEEKKTKSKGLNAKRCYCFEQDAAYIYSAFKTQYNLDLNELFSKDLHWWKFKALFESLDDELKMSKIMGYRLTNTTGMDKGQKKFYNEMKSQYALDVETNVDSKMALAKRNADMQKYVSRRASEVNSGQI